MRTRKKIWFLYSLIPIVIAIVVGIGIYTRAFGMFSPKEPYVKGEPDSIALDSVTDEGKNWIGEMGTGAKPATSDVPTCEGKKGTKDNPFVILKLLQTRRSSRWGILRWMKMRRNRWIFCSTALILPQSKNVLMFRAVLLLWDRII